MQRIKLNERQLLMLQKLQEDESKKKVLRINEDQFNRLFSGNSTPSSNLSKSIKKAGIDETSTKEIDLVEFAQELIVFIKDVLSRPKSMPFSSYWEGVGISKSKLFKMAKKEGLLALADENSEVKEYATPKLGFRKRVKELYKKINEKNNALNEFDGGYPAGADNDPNAPWRQGDSEQEDEKEAIKAEKDIMKLVYFNDKMDGASVFSYKANLFYISLADIDGEAMEPYEDISGHPNGETVYNYVNDKLQHKEIQIFKQNAPHGQLALITPKVKQQLLQWYGEDDKLTTLLNQLPESTGAGSSGAFVGAMSAPIKKTNTLSPEKSLQGLSEDNSINPKYTHFAVFKSNGKIVDGWEYPDTEPEDIKYYSKMDLNDNFPEYKVNMFKIYTIRGLKNLGIDNPFDSSNWGRPDYSEENMIDEAIDSSGVVAFKSERNGEEPFVIDGIKWQYVNADYDGKIDIGVYRYGQDITYSYDWFNKNVLGNGIEETTTTTSVGGDSGTFAYDAPAGDSSAFWNAGNKLNKGNAQKPKGMPIVKGGSMVEGTSKKEYENVFRPLLTKILLERIKAGQVYKNMAGRRKVQKVDALRGIIHVKQWGDGPAREYSIPKKQWGNWELLIERKILKITEAQLKRLLESTNMKSTAYPNGEMVAFDDCTKLNNNKTAQNGGCSQGAVDNVVKTTKTKNSVVAEGQFNPNVAAGSIYAIEIKANGAKVILTQDNGQSVVVHVDDIPDLIKVLDNFY